MEPFSSYVPFGESVSPSSAPLSASGPALPFSFTTLDGLITYFSQWLPEAYVLTLIETEKEVFVVRRECSLYETHLQFLKKCESALLRTLSEIQSGRASLDWNRGSDPGG